MPKIMEVCGTHTMSIFRHGLKAGFPENLKLISGPGCPVCVTSQGEIDCAIDLSTQRNVTIATFGDMVRVPGSRGSLAEMRAQGADVQVVLSAMDALSLAEAKPERQVVFLAVGFETTAPSTAATILKAKKIGVRNFSVLSLHKRVPPVLRKLASQKENRVDGLLLPGHVAVILGHEPFRFLAEEYRIPCTIAGFEPHEIMAAIVDILEQRLKGIPDLRSCYGSAVRPEGNALARAVMDRVFSSVPSVWRGIGEIEESGMEISPEFSDMNCRLRFGVEVVDLPEPEGCICGRILSGENDPSQCPLFGTACSPTSPVGPCMVSSEGTCSAWFRYGRRGNISWQN